MFSKRSKTSLLLILTISILFVSGCKMNNESNAEGLLLTLTGESETWDLSGYEVSLSKDSFKIGHGTLFMRKQQEYLTNLFSYKTYIVMNTKKFLVHSGSRTGEALDIQRRDIGLIESEPYYSTNTDLEEFEDITEIYMEVEWMDHNNVKVKETINLYPELNN